MPSRDHGFVGQLCWVCHQPIHGTGIFDAPPEDFGTTSYHEECWLGVWLPNNSFALAVSRIQLSAGGRLSHNDREAVIIDAAGKTWSFLLEHVDGEWVCKALNAKLVMLMERMFLLIRIEDDNE